MLWSWPTKYAFTVAAMKFITYFTTYIFLPKSRFSHVDEAGGVRETITSTFSNRSDSWSIYLTCWTGNENIIIAGNTRKKECENKEQVTVFLCFVKFKLLNFCHSSYWSKSRPRFTINYNIHHIQQWQRKSFSWQSQRAVRLIFICLLCDIVCKLSLQAVQSSTTDV